RALYPLSYGRVAASLAGVPGPTGATAIIAGMARPRPLRAAGREARMVVRGATTPHQHLRDRLVAIGLATVGINLICAVIGYFAERHVKDTDIHTFGSAIFWTSTQLLTVSSQLKNP